MFRVAVSGRTRDSEPSFFTVVVWRDQAEHAAESLTRGSRVVVMGRLQQRAWTAEDGSVRSLVEVMAEEVGPSLRWATATPVRATRSASVESVRKLSLAVQAASVPQPGGGSRPGQRTPPLQGVIRLP